MYNFLPKSNGHKKIFPTGYGSSFIVNTFLCRVHGIFLATMNSLQTFFHLLTFIFLNFRFRNILDIIYLPNASKLAGRHDICQVFASVRKELARSEQFYSIIECCRQLTKIQPNLPDVQNVSYAVPFAWLQQVLCERIEKLILNKKIT